MSVSINVFIQQHSMNKILSHKTWLS